MDNKAYLMSQTILTYVDTYIMRCQLKRLFYKSAG